MRNSASAVSIENLSKAYGSGPTTVHALRGVNLEIAKSSLTAIMGPSGSGKSTLFNCAAGLDKPSAGTVRIGDVEITHLRDQQLSRFRRANIGFIFQQLNLIPTLSAAENVQLPLNLAGRKLPRPALEQLMGRVGLGDRMNHYPNEMSGGQQQRVAIARAFAANPEIIFADEPTAALDSQTGSDVLTLMRESVDNYGSTIAMVTHDAMVASYADRVVFLADGQLQTELQKPSFDSITATMAALTRPSAA